MSKLFRIFLFNTQTLIIHIHMQDLEYFERFRPSTIDDIILPNRIKKITENGINRNYLFYSSSGTGKTSYARILLQNHTHIILDGKIGVESIRTTVDKFCRESNIFEKHSDNVKVVYFEEFDRASKDAQEELKSFTEKYKDRVRFIATSNNINALDPAILSRFTSIDFTPSTDEMKLLRTQHLERISKLIECDDKIIKSAIMKHYPDIRSVWNDIQTKIELGDNVVLITEDSKLYDLFITEQSDIDIWNYLYQNWIERYNVAFNILGKPLVNYIKKNHPDKTNKIGETMLMLTDYTDIRLVNSLDPFLTLYSLIIKLKQIYNK